MHLNGTGHHEAAHPAPILGKPPRRVLFFGKHMKRTRCSGALVEALRRHGLEVQWINMATLRRFLRPLANGTARWLHRRFRPDLIFVFCRDLPRALLDEMRQQAPVVLWVEEPLHDLCALHVDYFRAAQLVCMSNPGKFESLATQGLANFAFVMSGFSPTYHFPVPRKKAKRDLVFIGGPGPQGNRAEFLNRISAHYRTEIFGPIEPWAEWVERHPELRVRDPIKAPGYRAVCASSQIVLGMNQVNEDPLYFSNRTFLTLACRGFHLTRYVPGLETVFQDGVHLAWYRDEEECLHKIRHYLNAPHERERIAQAGHELVLSKHQYFHRIGEILAMLQSGIPRFDTAHLLQPHTPRTRVVGVAPAAQAVR